MNLGFDSEDQEGLSQRKQRHVAQTCSNKDGPGCWFNAATTFSIIKEQMAKHRRMDVDEDVVAPLGVSTKRRKMDTEYVKHLFLCISMLKWI